MGAVLAGLRVAVVGGDKRVEYCIPLLTRAGARVYAVGLDRLPASCDVVHVDLNRAFRECHIVLLPMQGMQANGTVKTSYSEQVLSLTVPLAAKGLLVLSGVACRELKELARQNGWSLVEIAEDDELAYLNSIPTAEGAVRMAQEKAVKTIHGSRALVTGYGRCGSTLAYLLKAMGAHVLASARDASDLARAHTLGLTPLALGDLPRALPSMDFIFNTIPALVFPRDFLHLTRRDIVIVDIASAPGGVDYTAAEELGRTAMLAPGLPGKYTPETAGQLLGRVLPRIIVENLPEER